MKTFSLRRGAALLALALLMFSPSAFALDAASPLTPLFVMVQTWLEGTLGALLSMIAFLVGIFGGLRTQNIWFVAIGVGFAAAIYFTPDIIVSFFTFAI